MGLCCCRLKLKARGGKSHANSNDVPRRPVALIVWIGAGLHAAHADSGSVVLTVFKGGWIIGGGRPRHAQVRRPHLLALGRRHRLRPGVRRIEDGVAGQRKENQARLRHRRRLCRGRRGSCRRRRRPRDRVTNQKGAVLELSGRQVGLMANADLSGLANTIN